MDESLKDRILGARFLAHVQPERRVPLLLGGLASLVALAAVSWWAAQPSYVVLVQGSDFGQSAQVAQALSGAGIRHRVTASGTEVLVDRNRFGEARLAIGDLGTGSAANRSGLEIFRTPSWSWTDFSEKVNYRDALEGKLASSIERVDGVRSADVSITLPESHPFRRTESTASAAVSLELRAGMSLSHEAVQSIKYMVAASVERLGSDDVSVLDTRGNVLSAPSPDGPLALADRHMEVRRGVERELSAKVASLLGNVYGGKNVRVEVSAVMDFDRVLRRSEAYSPEGQVILSEQITEVVPGQEIQIVSPAANTSTTNYQNPLSVESVERATGQITRLSVAVLVNETAVDVESGDPAEALASLENLVRGAVGFDAVRGDVVVVGVAPFDVPPVTESGRDYVWMLREYGHSGLGLLGILTTLLLGLRFTSALRKASGQPFQAPPAPRKEEEEEEDSVVSSPAQTSRQTVEEKEFFEQIQASRSNGADRPEAAAQVIRSWLREG